MYAHEHENQQKILPRRNSLHLIDLIFFAYYFFDVVVVVVVVIFKTS